MSIASVISSIETNVSNAYTSIGTKGGTIPANKNIANLSSAINSIPVGSSFFLNNPRTSLTKAIPDTIVNYSLNYTNSVRGALAFTDGRTIFLQSGTTKRRVTLSEPMGMSASSSVTWSGLTSFVGQCVWTDGDRIFYSDWNTGQVNYELTTKSTSGGTWSRVTLTLPSSNNANFYGQNVWTDGEHIYSSEGYSSHMEYNKTTSTWVEKSFTGIGSSTTFKGENIWTDGEHIYFSYGESYQYELDKATSTWIAKTWNGTNNFSGKDIWTDGINIYYSAGTAHYILDKATSTWTAKTWNGLSSFSGRDMICIRGIVFNFTGASSSSSSCYYVSLFDSTNSKYYAALNPHPSLIK